MAVTIPQATEQIDYADLYARWQRGNWSAYGPVGRDPDTRRVFFDLLARNARGEEVPHGTTIQWDFRDAEPWYLQLDGVVKRAIQGRVAKPTVRLRMGFEDFANLTSRRTQPYVLAARGRMRVRGNPRVLPKLERLFA